MLGFFVLIANLLTIATGQEKNQGLKIGSTAGFQGKPVNKNLTGILQRHSLVLLFEV